MALFCWNGRARCTGIVLVVAAVIGVVTAFLRLTAAITVTPAFLWVLFGVAIGYLAVAMIAEALARRGAPVSCPESLLTTLLVGILGTILTAVILLAFTFVATSILGAIITGALLFFFTLTVGSAACRVKCYAQYGG